MIGLIITWLVTAVSLFIIAQLSAFTGVEIDNFKKALISALVFGLLNALVRPVFAFFAFPLTFLTFGLFAFIFSSCWRPSALPMGGKQGRV
jgi:putative membrane protein